MSFVGFDICCNAVCHDAARDVWTVESNVLFESRSGLHELGIGVLKLTVNVTIIFPDVLAARGQRSLSSTQHVEQLLRQLRMRLAEPCIRQHLSNKFPETPAGHTSNLEHPVLNPQLAPHSKPWWRSYHRELIHRRVKERHTDVPDSTHLPGVGVFARGTRKQHPQHLQRLVDIISVDHIVLLHDNTTPDIGLVAIARLEVVTPPRNLNLGAFGNVCFVDPIVTVMIVHVSLPFLWVLQLAGSVAVQLRFQFNLASPQTGDVCVWLLHVIDVVFRVVLFIAQVW